MADDIDIEEHDVLESLRRRQQPEDPDVIIVKSEPLEVEYEESNYEESNYKWEWDEQQQPMEIKKEPHADKFRFGKIILGSKPAELENHPEKPSDIQLDEENYNYNMSLVLDDWGTVLDNSDCYCKECRILFATVNSLDAHKMIAHSFLMATDKQPSSPERNKAIKSTAKPTTTINQGRDRNEGSICGICNRNFAGHRSNLRRHYRTVHQIDKKTIENNIDSQTWRMCNHCKKYFPDDTSLVKHLYELLPIGNKNPTKDEKKSAGQSTVKTKPDVNVEKGPKANADIKPPSATKVPLIKKEVTTDVPVPNRIILGSKPMKAESETVNKEKWNCNICNIDYGRKYYLRHMRTYHPGSKISPITQKAQPTKVILTDSQVRYKCRLCQEILISEYAVKKHRQKHPNRKGRHILVRLVKSNKVKAKQDLTKKEINITKPGLAKKDPVKVYIPKFFKNAPLDEEKDVLVSKSTLFKCNRCSVHFLTCTGACQHSTVCESSSNIRDWACPQCQRVFRSAEKATHEFQHKVLQPNKFKVYVVYQEMIVRILCECPKCFICFEEDRFWKHVENGCSNAASYYCNECRVEIDIHSKANHDSKHKQGDFTKEDFIKIDYVYSKPEAVEDLKTPAKGKIETEAPKRGLKRKLEMSPVPKKRKRTLNDLNLFYCQFCRAYFGAKCDLHLLGKCKKVVPWNRFCKICGIHFRPTYYATHKALHQKFSNLTIADFTFTRMTDMKKIKPLQELHFCKPCKVYFMPLGAKRSHKCGKTPSTNCQICQKKIYRGSFDAHMRIHKYVIPKTVKTITEMEENTSFSNSSMTQNLAKKEPKFPTKQNFTKSDNKSAMTKFPDLLMKYHSLTALWNILYLCGICDTFNDSYDKVVEHCQNHLTNMENYGVVIKQCDICDMKFDSECYKRHLELHAKNKGINKKTFQILKYEHYDLFSEAWFDFIDLPEEQKTQVVSRSIYGANRCVKMRLIQQGPPEYTLYKCMKCSQCVPADSIVYHVKLSNCLKANKMPCSLCNMSFIIKRDWEEHEEIHRTTGRGIQTFRIVAFNDENDTDANKTIMSYDTENYGSKSKISFTDEELPSKAPQVNLDANTKWIVFYKCAVCDTSIRHLKNHKSHFCNVKQQVKCAKCGVLTHKNKIQGHEKLHQKYSFSRNNVIFKTFNKSGMIVNIKQQSPEKKASKQQKLNNDEPSKLYKCYCGLHYTSLKSIEKHYKLKNCNTVIREKCSQCDLLFDPIEVVNHLCKHHAQNQVKTFNVVTSNKKTLYKCGLCHVLFYNQAAALPHKAKCVGNLFGKKCEHCGLVFDATSIATHMVDHERNNKLKTDCYVIVKIPDPTTTVADRRVPPNTLYKCTRCDIHFLERSSARVHQTKIKDCTNTHTDICRICKLKFPRKSIPKHVTWQHNKLKIKDFNIIEVFYGVNKKIPAVGSDIVPQVKQELKQVKEEEVPKIEVNVTMYQCKKCSLLFMDEKGLITHLQDRCSKELSEECEECNAKVATKNIREHNREHGPSIVLVLNIVDDVKIPEIPKDVKIPEIPKDVKIKRKERRIPEQKPNATEWPLDRYDKQQLFKCTECNFHFLTMRTLEKHQSGRYCNQSNGVKCNICNILFTKISLARHRQIHEKYKCKKEDFVVLEGGDVDNIAKQSQVPVEQDMEQDTSSLDSNVEIKEPESIQRTPDNPVIEEMKKDVHFLFKCADCNLYFNTQKTCHKHITDHASLDPREYIGCKLCGFQFTIMGLPPHIKKHHAKEFNFDEVLVEEYQPNDIRTYEKYYASEKDQSALVSTSEDVKNVSILKEDDACEVTSCNEIAENGDSSDALSCDLVYEEDDNLIAENDQTIKDLKEVIEPNDVVIDSAVNSGTQDKNVTGNTTKVDSSDALSCALVYEGDDDVIAENDQTIKDLKEVIEPNDVVTDSAVNCGTQDKNVTGNTTKVDSSDALSCALVYEGDDDLIAENDQTIKDLKEVIEPNDVVTDSAVNSGTQDNNVTGTITKVDSSDALSCALVYEGDDDVIAENDQTVKDLKEVIEPNDVITDAAVDSGTQHINVTGNTTKVNEQGSNNPKVVSEFNLNEGKTIEDSSENKSDKPYIDVVGETKVSGEISNDKKEISEVNLIVGHCDINNIEENVSTELGKNVSGLSGRISNDFDEITKTNPEDIDKGLSVVVDNNSRLQPSDYV